MIKKFVNSIIFVLIVRSGLLTTDADDSCTDTAPDPTLNPILSTGALNFSINLYNGLKSATNLFYSPFSVRVALTMTSVGAGGNTLTQMNSALQLNGFQNENQIDQASQSYLSSFCPNSNYTLSTANRIYIQQGFPIIQNFVQTLNTYYQSSAENVNFQTNAGGTASEINSWVEQQTNNTIKNLFSAQSFSSNTVLVLVNAIYFKGTWQTEFNPANTVPETFTLANKTTVQVKTMKLTSTFKYYDSPALKSQVLQLNYASTDNRLAMHIILPHEGTALSAVQQSLNSQNVNDYIGKLTSTKVQVSLPKFTANFKQELSGPLQSLGMKDVFSNTAANLSGIASNGNLYVSSVIHQAYVAVDEQGTTAAAATGIVVSTYAMIDGPRPNPPIPFIVNRPCIYLICDMKYVQILFMGNLDNPLSTNGS